MVAGSAFPGEDQGPPAPGLGFGVSFLPFPGIDLVSGQDPVIQHTDWTRA